TRDLHPFPTRRSSDLSPETDKASDPSYLNEYKSRRRRLIGPIKNLRFSIVTGLVATLVAVVSTSGLMQAAVVSLPDPAVDIDRRSEEHTSELQSPDHL